MIRDHIGLELQAMMHRIDEREAAEARRGIKAWLLAPDIPTYLALMRGEDVPLSTLNPKAVERYGTRTKTRDDSRPCYDRTGSSSALSGVQVGPGTLGPASFGLTA